MTEKSTTCVRTQEEILARYKELDESPFDDFFGATRSDLIGALDFEHAQPYLKEGVTEDQWTADDPAEEARRYLPFALEKAVGHRGLSSGRSIDHYRAWVWLMGVDEKIDTEEYPLYGAPILRQVAEYLEVDISEHLDEEELAMFKRMADGRPCVDGCQAGC